MLILGVSIQLISKNIVWHKDATPSTWVLKPEFQKLSFSWLGLQYIFCCMAYFGHEKKLGFDTWVFLISNEYLSPIRHLQRRFIFDGHGVIQTLKNKRMHIRLQLWNLLILKIRWLIAWTGIQRVPALYSSVIQEPIGGISPLKIQLRKLIIQLKEPPPLPYQFIVQLFTTFVSFKVFQTICFTCFERQHGVTGMV